MSKKRSKRSVVKQDIPQPKFKSKEWIARRKKNSKKYSRHKSLKQILTIEKYDKYPPNVATYTNIEAGPSVKPYKKYCDITGLSGKYIDPNTKLRYHNVEAYNIIKTLPKNMIKGYLALRKADNNQQHGIH